MRYHNSNTLIIGLSLLHRQKIVKLYCFFDDLLPHEAPTPPTSFQIRYVGPPEQVIARGRVADLPAMLLEAHQFLLALPARRQKRPKGSTIAAVLDAAGLRAQT